MTYAGSKSVSNKLNWSALDSEKPAEVLWKD